MRLFTGIALPADIADNLNRLIDGLRPAAHFKWTPAYNLHLTTKFIGEWPEDRLPELTGVLATLRRGRAPIAISVAGIGWFPNPHHPRVLWTGVKAGPDLAQLAADTDEAVATLGIARETKPYSPHLTLARIKDVVPLTKIRQAIADLPSADFGSFVADRFHLYLSKPGPTGSIYTKLAEIPLLPE
ncbi:MAG TPA: RNA 2',3'-cyclic phosphodiesterase [Bryobacteraceae bacterium]|nr:RNA 2',3'-cyclic phosphodiesterase [Bryobacteraceae bacterium]